MTAAVLTGAGRAVPATYEQDDVWQGFFATHYAGVRAAERIFRNTGVLRRHAVANPVDEDLSQWSTGARMQRYIAEALPLGKQAVAGALDAAGLAPGDIGYVNLHGTGTRANDAMEDAAVLAVCGEAVPCSSTKGFTGHTLGACGILEVLLAREAVAGGFIPGCLGVEQPDPAFRSRVATTNLDRPPRRVLKNAFGFGGTNCSLLLGSIA